jgi:hypothetical protein
VLRTVTFSDAKVAAVVNANFVSAWHNRAPGFRNTEDTTEKSIFEHSNEAFPTKNICTFILTPDGRVFHYMAGYASPELFLRFLDDALALRRAAFDDRMTPTAGGLEALRKIHAERAAASAKEKSSKPCDVEVRTYRGITHRHTDLCEWRLREAAAYLVRLHEFWRNAAELPTLADVRYKYLYGNDFSEENPGASPIQLDTTLPRALK